MDNSKKINYIIKNKEKLSLEQKQEVYKIIQKNQMQHTKNKNGIFINLTDIDSEKINEIYNYVNFSIITNKNLEKRNKKKLKKIYEIKKNDKNTVIDTVKKIDNDNKFIDDTKILLKKNKKTYNLSQKKIIKNYKTVKNKVMLPLYLSQKMNTDEETEEIEDYLEENI